MIVPRHRSACVIASTRGLLQVGPGCQCWPCLTMSWPVSSRCVPGPGPGRGVCLFMWSHSVIFGFGFGLERGAVLVGGACALAGRGHGGAGRGGWSVGGVPRAAACSLELEAHTPLHSPPGTARVVLCHQQPSRVEPSRAGLSRTEPSRVEASRTEPGVPRATRRGGDTGEAGPPAAALYQLQGLVGGAEESCCRGETRDS